MSSCSELECICDTTPHIVPLVGILCYNTGSMFKPLAILSVLSAAWIAVAATSSALPADRLALAKEFARRGLHAEALKELEAMAGAQGIAEDEYLYRLGEEYRVLGRMAESLAQIGRASCRERVSVGV